jgi:AcrR family transcriptional regulator
MKKEKTKSKIIQAAIKCFTELGVENTKLVDIARAAEINHSLVLYHYKEFDSLCYDVIDSLVQDFFQFFYKVSFNSNQQADSLLKSFISTHFILAKKNRGKYSIWLYFYYKASQDRKYQQLLALIRFSLREKIGQVVQSYVPNKVPPLDHDEFEYISNYILSVISGNLILALTEEKQSIHIFQKYCFDQIHQFLSSFLTSKYPGELSSPLKNNEASPIAQPLSDLSSQ